MIATTPHPVVLRNNELTIRTATESFEISQLRAVLDEQHYLKAGRPAGHVLWQGACANFPANGNVFTASDLCLPRASTIPSRHQGTLYKVTNWTPLGLTKGFRRHRADFYQDLESTKQLWIRPLQKNARSLLSLPGPLPEEHQKGIAEATCGARCALPNSTLRSLREALRQVADPRNPKSRRHPISAMLTLICYGLLCGASDVKAIWKKCGPFNQQQRAAIGLTKRCKKSGLLIMPGYDAFRFTNHLRHGCVHKVFP